jgi:hypothetical protein
MSDPQKSTQDSMQAFATFWDYQARDIWGADYAQALADLLKSYDADMILDCAGGTGFPAIEFKQQGLNISYSDGSPEMLAFFNAKRFEEKLTIPTYLSSWQELPKRVPYAYDAVLCRGNSLLYLGAYTDDAPQSRKSALSMMQEAIEGMFSKVSDDGFLYIDMPKPEKSKPEEPYTVTGTDSLTFKVKATVSYDPETQVRKTSDVITNLLNNTETTTIAHTYPLDEKELFAMLLNAGFQRVEKSPIKEASFINAYLAFK